MAAALPQYAFPSRGATGDEQESLASSSQQHNNNNNNGSRENMPRQTTESFYSTTTAPMRNDDLDGKEPQTMFSRFRARTSSITSSSIMDRARPKSRSSFFGRAFEDDSEGEDGRRSVNDFRKSNTDFASRPSSFFEVTPRAVSPSPTTDFAVGNTGDNKARLSFYGLAEPASASIYTMPIDSDQPPMATGPVFDHSHLQPGILASLLSHEKTLDLYRANAKKTNDPEIQFEFCTFVMQVVGEMQQTISDASSSTTGSKDSSLNTSATLVDDAKQKREALLAESVALLSKLAHRGHVKSQYYLADCYTQGIGTSKGKRDYEKAFPLFVLAGKHGHPDACFRAAQCCEHGWGCPRSSSKAVSLLRRGAVFGHPGAMHRLGLAEINGELGLSKRPREGVKWLKRAAELADTVDPPQPQSLHELAMLSEKGIENVIFKDETYAAELLARASELQYAPSAYKLGECYEYGRMGCPQDSALSIHYYNIAAQQNHKEACFALTAWYLVGSPGVLPQSDTEAYLWARKAADMGLAKAEYAVGYFTEMGMGTYKDQREAMEWFRKAADQGDKRAIDRLRQASGGPFYGSGRPPPVHRQAQNIPPPSRKESPPAAPEYKSPTVTKRIVKPRQSSAPARRPSIDQIRSRPLNGRSESPQNDSSQQWSSRQPPVFNRQRSHSQPRHYEPPTSEPRPYAPLAYSNEVAPPVPGAQFKPIQAGQARMPARQGDGKSLHSGDNGIKEKVLQKRKTGEDKDCIIS